MDKVTGTFEENRLIISVAGHIDSGNAPEIEEQINALRKEFPEGGITIDADYLEYISSSGLRIILRLLKNNPDLKIANASTEIYEIFETTGFTDILPVEKARRRISIDGCEVIGRGANGTVYRLDPETVVKIYHQEDAFDEMKRERDIAKKAFILGIPTAIPYDIVRVGNTFGTVFECLHAKSITKLIKEEPEKLDEHTAAFVELMKHIHSTACEPGLMPDFRETAFVWLELIHGHIPEESFEKLDSLFRAIPQHNFIIHGDYHTNNVLVQNGEPILIDMDTLSIGHPIFELASMFNACCGFGSCNPAIIENFLGIPMKTSVKIWEKALRLYLGSDDEDYIRSVEDKAKLVGYTRILRRSILRLSGTEDGENLIAFCKKEILSLLEKVDCLTF